MTPGINVDWYRVNDAGVFVCIGNHLVLMAQHELSTKIVRIDLYWSDKTKEHFCSLFFCSS